MAVWDPAVYERYKVQRDRPALDLLLQIPHDLQPSEIWDLGCGTGEHAAVLAARHPNATVHGLDSSLTMLAAARRRAARVDWRHGDITAFAPEIPPNLIFTNAAMGWVDDHARLFPALAGSLARGGVFACQMPVNSAGRWRELLQETAAEPRFSADLAGVPRRTIDAASEYYDRLRPVCPGGVDIWTTEYLYQLPGEDAVLEWARGTTLLPYSEALTDPCERQAFLDSFAAKLRLAYPRRADGVTLLPFQRLFILARR
jgi:trans-aconitate 2-methyltransferase